MMSRPVYKAVIFDLDGTLLDTLGDITSAVNMTMSQMGCAHRTRGEVCSFIGNGARMLMVRSLPDGDERVDEALRLFRENYSRCCMDTTCPFPGISELVERLINSGCRVGIVSNKPDVQTNMLAQRFFPGIPAQGESERSPRKPDPTGLLNMIKDFGCEPGEVLYVGDSQVDKQVADNAGTDCALVTWGFRSVQVLAPLGAQYLVDETAQLSQFLFE